MVEAWKVNTSPSLGSRSYRLTSGSVPCPAPMSAKAPPRRVDRSPARIVGADAHEVEHGVGAVAREGERRLRPCRASTPSMVTWAPSSVA